MGSTVEEEEKAEPKKRRTRKKKTTPLFDDSGNKAEEQETPKPKKYKSTLLFDYLANILTEKSETKFNYHVESDEFPTSFEGFMVLKFLSMHKSQAVRNVIFANQIALERMNGRHLYRFLLQNVPKQYSPFIKYIKPSTDKEKK